MVLLIFGVSLIQCAICTTLLFFLRKGKKIKIQLWDTAGQERYHSMTTTYYRGANGFILLFDLTHERSFHSCSSWYVVDIMSSDT